jgi:hypothetical protein
MKPFNHKAFQDQKTSNVRNKERVMKIDLTNNTTDMKVEKDNAPDHGPEADSTLPSGGGQDIRINLIPANGIDLSGARPHSKPAPPSAEPSRIISYDETEPTKAELAVAASVKKSLNKCAEALKTEFDALKAAQEKIKSLHAAILEDKRRISEAQAGQNTLKARIREALDRGDFPEETVQEIDGLSRRIEILTAHMTDIHESVLPQAEADLAQARKDMEKVLFAKMRELATAREKRLEEQLAAMTDELNGWEMAVRDWSREIGVGVMLDLLRPKASSFFIQCLIGL